MTWIEHGLQYGNCRGVKEKMKKYFKTYRRKPNSIFFLVLGSIFAVLGILAIFWTQILALAVGCMAFGVLLAVLPQFVLFEKYGLRGDVLHYKKGGFPCKVQVSEIGAVVLCIYDEYRRGKGFIPAKFTTENGDVYIPAMVLLRSLDENELDVCDTRTATGITFRKQKITDAVLDFDFLEELWRSGFSGKIYVSEAIASLYKPALDEIFQDSDRVTVYDRLPSNRFPKKGKSSGK